MRGDGYDFFLPSSTPDFGLSDGRLSFCSVRGVLFCAVRCCGVQCLLKSIDNPVDRYTFTDTVTELR